MNESLSKLGFEKAGHFQLAGEGFELVPESELGSGVYAETVNDDVKYIGQTNSLIKRFRGYGKRPIKYKTLIIPEQLKRGNAVELWFLSSEKYSNWTIVLNKEFEVEKPDRLLIERYLISLFNPEWNKDLKQVKAEVT